MSEKEFRAAIDALISRAHRRARKLEAIRSGARDLRVVKVKGYRVRSYTVAPHVRYL